MRKIRLPFFVILLIFLVFISILIYPYLAPPVFSYDVVIYGGGFAGCAAAYSAAWAAPEKEILLIVSEPVPALGGLGTVGGQNFADIRYWRNELVTEGSWQRWFEESGQFYNTEEMAERLQKELSQFPNLTILYQHDLKKAKTKKVAKSKNIIKSVILAPVYRTEQGSVLWEKGSLKVEGEVFIDASDEGRLVRLAGHPLSVGRQDWPREYLPSEEQGEGWARQQAATLMFKVTGVKMPEEPSVKGDLHFVTDIHGSWAIIGGKETWQNNSIIKRFNELYGAQGLALKPLNAAQSGAASEEWWVNMLLVFDVDGRAREKDRGTSLFVQKGVGAKTVDQAWQEAREILQEPEFLEALREFKVVENGEMYGFGEASLVRDEKKKPVVGEVMYLRETVHLLQEPEDGERYALTTEAVQQAGSNSQEGGDRENYAERIGLGYYMMDINAFMYSDILQEGNYVWPVTGYLRPDWQRAGGQPVNPVYLPYAMLKATKCANLLVPGYATGCSSFAWAEVRVLPNLTVLGDAAGVAAARAVLFGERPTDFRAEQINWVQDKLCKMGARLDK